MHLCETLQCIVLSVLFAIDREHEREKIKNLLAHGQFSGSSKIIHQAYNGDFRVSPMIIFVIGMRVVLVDKVAVESK